MLGWLIQPLASSPNISLPLYLELVGIQPLRQDNITFNMKINILWQKLIDHAPFLLHTHYKHKQIHRDTRHKIFRLTDKQTNKASNKFQTSPSFVKTCLQPNKDRKKVVLILDPYHKLIVFSSEATL